MDIVNQKLLILGLSLGILVSYLIYETPKVICKVVTPDNYYDVNYKRDNKCYNLDVKEVSCEKNNNE